MAGKIGEQELARNVVDTLRSVPGVVDIIGTNEDSTETQTVMGLLKKAIALLETEESTTVDLTPVQEGIAENKAAIDGVKTLVENAITKLDNAAVKLSTIETMVSTVSTKLDSVATAESLITESQALDAKIDNAITGISRVASKIDGLESTMAESRYNAYVYTFDTDFLVAMSDTEAVTRGFIKDIGADNKIKFTDYVVFEGAIVENDYDYYSDSYSSSLEKNAHVMIDCRRGPAEAEIVYSKHSGNQGAVAKIAFTVDRDVEFKSMIADGLGSNDYPNKGSIIKAGSKITCYYMDMGTM